MRKPRCLGFFCHACLLAASALVLSAPVVHGSPKSSGYKVIRKMPIGGEGGWDYLTVDTQGHRLFISRGTHTMVVYEVSGKVVGDILETKGVHGIALAYDLGKGFTSNGGEATVTVFDLATLQPISKIKTTGENPDSIIYDPDTKRVFTFNGRSANSTAIDATSGKVVGTIPLGGKPETPVLDGKGSIFVNIESKDSLLEFDTKSLTVKHTYPMPGCKSPSGIGMDTANRRVFAGCSDTNKMAVMNADTGKEVALVAIGDDTDAVGFDPTTHLAFASCRAGVLSVISQESPDKYSEADNVETQLGARTMALDPMTHHVFVVTADLKPAPSPTKEEPEPRPQPIPGTFVVLEVATQ